MGMQPILPITVPVKTSKVPPVNVTVMVTESFGVNRPLDNVIFTLSATKIKEKFSLLHSPRVH